MKLKKEFLRDTKGLSLEEYRIKLGMINAKKEDIENDLINTQEDYIKPIQNKMSKILLEKRKIESIIDNWNKYNHSIHCLTATYDNLCEECKEKFQKWNNLRTSAKSVDNQKETK